MNYKDYKKIMDDKELVSTFESEMYLANAAVYNKTINNILNMPDSQKKLYPNTDFEKELKNYQLLKDGSIKMAIHCSSKREMISDIEIHEMLVDEFRKSCFSRQLEQYKLMSNEEIKEKCF